MCRDSLKLCFHPFKINKSFQPSIETSSIGEAFFFFKHFKIQLEYQISFLFGEIPQFIYSFIKIFFLKKKEIFNENPTNIWTDTIKKCMICLVYLNPLFHSTSFSCFWMALLSIWFYDPLNLLETTA